MLSRHENEGKKVVRRYTVHYLLAMGLVTGSIIVGAFHTNQILELNRSKGQIVQAAAEQYSLAQRLILLPDSLAIESNAYKQSRILAAMRDTIDQMRSGHDFLMYGNADTPAPSEGSQALQLTYGAAGGRLDWKVKNFLEAFERYWADPVEQASQIALERANARDFLLVSLEGAVELHARTAEEKMARAINVHRSWVAVAVSLIIMVIVLVFRPLVGHAGRSVATMTAQLDEGAALRSRSFKIAKLGHLRIANATPKEIWFSKELLDLLEFEGEEGNHPSSLLQGHLDPHEVRALMRVLRSTWKVQENVEARIGFKGADGATRELLINFEPEVDSQGEMVGLVGVVNDRTAEAEAEQALMQSYDLIQRKSNDLVEAQRLGKLGTWRNQKGCGTVELDESAMHLLGLDPETFVSTIANVRACYIDDGAERIDTMNKAVIESGEAQSTTVQARRCDGTVLDLLIRSKLERDEAGNVVSVFGTMQDISKERATARELEQLAYYDGLTGLANRTLFTRQLKRVGEAAAKGELNAALLLIDLDHFKEVNDTLGHQAGDQLLDVVASRLAKTVIESGFVARLGGDEFAVLLEDYSCQSEIDDLCERIIDSISRPASLSLGTVQTNASIGITLAPAHSCEPDELLSYADLALYSSKEQGRGRACYYETSYSKALGTRISLGNEIRSALQDKRFETHYQPIVDAQTGTVSGFEALLRLPRIGGGFIPPSEFIPIAESSHLIADLGALVLQQACAAGQSWIDAGLPVRTVSVNVSAAQIWHGDLEHIIDDALSTSGFDPRCLCIELTESVFVADGIGRLEGVLTRLKERGILIALDDFGTGYSSLGYLNRMPFDKLKVDRSFVTNAHASAEKRKLLNGVISLAKGLNLQVTAEGVETQEELALVKDLGCDHIQGWFYGKALPADQAATDAARIDGLRMLDQISKPKPNPKRVTPPALPQAKSA